MSAVTDTQLRSGRKRAVYGTGAGAQVPGGGATGWRLAVGAGGAEPGAGVTITFTAHGSGGGGAGRGVPGTGGGRAITGTGLAKSANRVCFVTWVANPDSGLHHLGQNE